MKISIFWVLFLVVGTALVFLSVSTEEITSPVTANMGFTLQGTEAMTTTSRKLNVKALKGNGYTSRTDKSDRGNINLEDYHPIDPVPSSKASIRPGPIQHGTPLMPFIPKPSPPDHPRRGGIP